MLSQSVGPTGVVTMRKILSVSCLDSGILTKRAVDNLHVGFHEPRRWEAPSECVIEYYTRTNPNCSKQSNRVKDEDHPFNNPVTGRVNNLTVEEPVAAGKMNRQFDKVDTYAVRIRMNARRQTWRSSISEIQVFCQ